MLAKVEWNNHDVPVFAGQYAGFLVGESILNAMDVVIIANDGNYELALALPVDWTLAHLVMGLLLALGIAGNPNAFVVAQATSVAFNMPLPDAYIPEN